MARLPTLKVNQFLNRRLRQETVGLIGASCGDEKLRE